MGEQVWLGRGIFLILAGDGGEAGRRSLSWEGKFHNHGRNSQALLCILIVLAFLGFCFVFLFVLFWFWFFCLFVFCFLFCLDSPYPEDRVI